MITSAYNMYKDHIKIVGRYLQYRTYYTFPIILNLYISIDQHCKEPEIFSNYTLSRWNENTKINTRNKHNLHINIFKTSFG